MVAKITGVTWRLFMSPLNFYITNNKLLQNSTFLIPVKLWNYILCYQLQFKYPCVKLFFLLNKHIRIMKANKNIMFNYEIHNGDLLCLKINNETRMKYLWCFHSTITSYNKTKEHLLSSLFVYISHIYILANINAWLSLKIFFLNNNLTHFLMPTNSNADENTKLPKWQNNNTFTICIDSWHLCRLKKKIQKTNISACLGERELSGLSKRVKRIQWKLIVHFILCFLNFI